MIWCQIWQLNLVYIGEKIIFLSICQVSSRRDIFNRPVYNFETLWWIYILLQAWEVSFWSALSTNIGSLYIGFSGSRPSREDDKRQETPSLPLLYFPSFHFSVINHSNLLVSVTIESVIVLVMKGCRYPNGVSPVTLCLYRTRRYCNDVWVCFYWHLNAVNLTIVTCKKFGNII